MTSIILRLYKPCFTKVPIVALLIFSYLVKAQGISPPNPVMINRDSLLRQNLDALEFNWLLAPSKAFIMKEGLRAIANLDWETGIDRFSQIIADDSTFLPAFHYRYICYSNFKYNANKKKADDDKKILYHTLLNTVSKESFYAYSYFWNTCVPNNNWKSKPRLLEIAPPFLHLTSYILNHSDKLSTQSFDSLKNILSFFLIAKPYKAIRMANEEQTYSNCLLYLKALAFQFTSNNDSSFYLFQEVLKNDKTVIEAHENMALYKSKLNDKSGTLMHLNAMITIEPESMNIRRFSGLLKAQLEEYQEAIVDLNQFIRFDSTDFDCLKQCLIAKHEIGDYRGSLKIIDQIIKLKHKDMDVFFYQSENYLKMGDITRCIEVLERGKKYFPPSYMYDLYLANKLAEVGLLKRAQTAVNRIVDDLPSIYLNDIYLNRAYLIQSKIYFIDGKPEKALQMIEALVGKSGEQPEYLLLRAKIYLSIDEKNKAKADLEKVLNSSLRNEAIRILNNL